ncbi:MAG: aminotransferase class I/II-fold pyridoxal phosphate-dependent enzyme [Phenylobacterium sp.]|nr:aminotransferase class I/II-fold pyridoxal phosphate-dependent enzyme [Phenylobacterium sp.]MCA3724625.1 aminotransferase class I/II-fold pyridoxal phosphate-dependent enzyme [Phenylobacterium sp.]MCA3727451.1 aminotransferase class I/II-fold pyridoxal phosphate-dependent enzyme [Phenylobacterium sp.]MCA3732572.1 aminotransferase class I/II-fold pyridoxal phosphate-dependent enzyme [Phenylobacterium sp.]MCA3739078.1 aminotransferase class I/II-fold pyridoxal phosphate-dependent enzyme [Pheny
MEFGQPSTGAPAGAIAAAHQALDSDPGSYWESQDLKVRLSRHYQETYGVDLPASRILLTCGASPALVLALSTCFAAGDRIALARPGYVAYRNTLRALHLEPVEIPCGPEVSYQLTASALDEVDGPLAGVIIASPANPTGSILPPREIEAIVRTCEARRMGLVSDEIYHGLSYVEPARSVLEFTDQAFVVNSFSKYFSMVAWRLGWLAAPAAHAERARALISNLFLTPPSLSQHAALAALDCREELQANIEVYRQNRTLLLDALPRLGLASIAPPDGAFYIYANVGHLTDDSLAFCERILRETGVALAPGVDFDPVDGRRFIRISFAVSTDLVREAIDRLAPWFAIQPRRS